MMAIILDSTLSTQSFVNRKKRDITLRSSTKFAVSTTTEILHMTKNMISRMRNCLIGAIRDKKILPKYIVIVLDNDVINYGLHHGVKSSIGFGRLLKWLMCQYNRIVATQKEYLPTKAKKSTYPSFIWIEPPMHIQFSSHDNYIRREFTKALQTQVAYHENMYSLQLKKRSGKMMTHHFTAKRTGNLLPRD